MAEAEGAYGPPAQQHPAWPRKLVKTTRRFAAVSGVLAVLALLTGHGIPAIVSTVAAVLAFRVRVVRAARSAARALTPSGCG